MGCSNQRIGIIKLDLKISTDWLIKRGSGRGRLRIWKLISMNCNLWNSEWMMCWILSIKIKLGKCEIQNCANQWLIPKWSRIIWSITNMIWMWRRNWWLQISNWVRCSLNSNMQASCRIRSLRSRIICSLRQSVVWQRAIRLKEKEMTRLSGHQMLPGKRISKDAGG